MQLYFKGNPLFNAGAAAVTSDTLLIRADTGRPLRYRTRIHVHAFLEYNQNTGGQAGLTAMEATLRSQLLNNYGDLVLKQDSGAYSGLALANANSISGVVIDQGPTFSEAMDSEYVNRRTVEFSGVAEFVIQNTANAVVSFRETLAYQGTGGPVTSWRPAVNAPPVQQQVFPSSTIKLVQTGRAVGHLAYPKPPGPFFAYPIEKVHLREFVEEDPQRVGPGLLALVNYPVTWKYVYESTLPLAALPNLPPF